MEIYCFQGVVGVKNKKGFQGERIFNKETQIRPKMLVAQARQKNRAFGKFGWPAQPAARRATCVSSRLIPTVAAAGINFVLQYFKL